MPKVKKLNRRLCRLDPILGKLHDFDCSMLPTYDDVLKQFILLRNTLSSNENGKFQSVKKITNLVAKKLETIWKKTSITIISNQRISQIIYDTYNNYKSSLKYSGNPRKIPLKIQNFFSEAKVKLFDIAACKCIELSKCKCNNDQRVSNIGMKFLIDQRLTRKLTLDYFNQNESSFERKSSNNNFNNLQTDHFNDTVKIIKICKFSIIRYYFRLHLFLNFFI